MDWWLENAYSQCSNARKWFVCHHCVDHFSLEFRWNCDIYFHWETLGQTSVKFIRHGTFLNVIMHIWFVLVDFPLPFMKEKYAHTSKWTLLSFHSRESTSSLTISRIEAITLIKSVCVYQFDGTMWDGAMSLLLATAVNDHKFLFRAFYVHCQFFQQRMRFSGLFMLTDHFEWFFLMVVLMSRYTIDFHPNKSFQLQRKPTI